MLPSSWPRLAVYSPCFESEAVIGFPRQPANLDPSLSTPISGKLMTTDHSSLLLNFIMCFKVEKEKDQCVSFKI